MDTGQVYIEWREGGEFFCTKPRLVTIWSKTNYCCFVVVAAAAVVLVLVVKI